MRAIDTSEHYGSSFFSFDEAQPTYVSKAPPLSAEFFDSGEPKTL
jgi:hypothetical protein